MADAKITALTADTSPTSDDLIVTVTDPAGTPANRKVTAANFITKASGVTASRALVTDASGVIGASATTDTEIGYVSGVTSAIQTQLNNKQPLDAQLTSLAALSYAGNGNKVVRVNAGETDFELAAAAGGGDVSKVGTPVNNQVGVWTGDGTLEGDAALTFDTTTDTLAVGGTIELGHASDTTLSRTGAGDIAVEGNAIYRAGGTDVPVADGGTGASTAAAARVNLGVMNIVVLASDYTNSNAVANTLEDVTDFKFPVVNGGTYYFHIVTDLTTAATSTGFRVAINGPAATRMSYRNVSGLTATTQTIAHGLTSYSLPAASGATSAATGGTISVIEGFITPSASGDVQVQIASEVSASAVTAKAGSIIEWYRCL